MRRLMATALIAAAWTALGVFFAVTTSLTYVSQNRAPLWGPVLAQSLAQWWLWALLTPVVIWLSRRWPIARGRVASGVTVHALAGVGIAVGKVIVENYVRQWLFGVRPYLVLNNLALQFSIFWALAAAAHVVQRYLASRARASAAESALARAELQLLRTQLQPHFLFNALGSIAELVHEDPQKADRMLDRLSTLLRATLDAGDRQEITLADELALLRGYLDIQQTRFGERLSVSIDVADGCLSVRVPCLLLQPIVENAIHHGITPRAAGGAIEVTASLAGGRLVLTVEDDGPGPQTASAEGIGLSNTRTRLAALYSRASAVELRPRPGGGTIAAITIPARGSTVEPRTS